MISDPLLDSALEPARLDAVRWIGDALGDLDVSFARVTRLLAHLIQAPIAAFALVDRDRQIIAGAFGLPFKETTVAQGAFCRTCVAQNDLLVVPDAAADERFADTLMVAGPPHVRFYAGVPVRSPNGLPVGTLCIVDTVPRVLSDDERAILEDLRSNVEETILLRTLSINDPLTGLYNRRYFDDLLEREWRRSQRRGLAVTVISVDVDHFKTYNDRYGHPAGDGALKAVGAVLTSCFGRAGDVVARYGGDEFAVLLPETDEAAADMLTQRLMNAVRALQIAHDANPAGRLTVSAGTITTAGEGAQPDPARLLEGADAALYAAKAAGRNRVHGLKRGPARTSCAPSAAFAS